MQKKANNLFFIIISLLTVLCWFFLYKQYSIFNYSRIPYFALDKIPGHYQSSVLHFTTLLFIILSVCYIIGFYLLRRSKTISTLVKLIIIFTLLLIGVINVLLYPVGALDIFYYISESKIFYFYHQNPYITLFRAFPNDILMDYTIFPTFALLYGPLWLFLSSIPFLIVDSSNLLYLLVSYKVFSFIFFSGTLVIVCLFGKDKKIRWQLFYLASLNPFLLFETITNAHNDIILVFFLLLSIFFLKKKHWLTLPFLALSILIKYYTIVLLPFFLLKMFRNKINKAVIMKSFTISLLLLIGFFVPFLIHGSINNFVQAITSSVNIYAYSIFSLLKEFSIQINGTHIERILWIFLLLVFLIFYLIRIRGYQKEDEIQTSIDILLVFLVLLSLMQPWYLVPVLLLLIVNNKRGSIVFMFIITFTSLIFYPISVWAWFNSGFSVFNIHLFQSIFITLPILLYFLFRGVTKIS